MTDVVAKLWGFCHTLRHDGIDYGDYIEQLTYLLFLKMADEREIEMPEKADWPYLRKQSGTELLDTYVEALRILGRQPGILGDIYSGAQSRFTNPVNLHKLVGLIDDTEWTSLDIDVKAAVFEGLLEKAASEGKKGAGQYFTPRILIQAIVRCMKPDPRVGKDFAIGDPACGTGGFLVAAYEWLKTATDGAFKRDEAKRIRQQTYFGQELVFRPRRLALMNLYLHQVEPHIALGDSIYEIPSDQRFDVVLTNPPFGTKGANQSPERDDFVIQTSNKQLNFVQHVLTVLKPGGRAAIVVPDNVLFADQAAEVFQVLMEDCDLHTVLRNPHGTFSPYTEGTKTNVIFFTKGISTEQTWIYDGRANVPKITKKDRPLSTAHFAEFEKCYGADPNGRSKRAETDSSEGRWRSFSIEDVRKRHFKLDAFKWIRDEEYEEAGEIPEPQELATAMMEELQLALDELSDLQQLFENGDAESSEGTRLQVRGLPSVQSHLHLALTTTARLRQAALGAACMGRLTADWRTDQLLESVEDALEQMQVSPSVTGRRATDEIIPGDYILSVGNPAIDTPEGWLWAPLTRVARLESGHTPSRKHPEYWGGDVPWIGIQDARENHGRWIADTAQHINEVGLEHSSARLLPAGTVCVSRTASVGYVVIMSRPMATSQDFVNWVCSEALEPEFLMYAFLAEGPGLKRFGRGTTHTTIYFPEVKALYICLPPVAEQREICKIVRALLGETGHPEIRY